MKLLQAVTGPHFARISANAWLHFAPDPDALGISREKGSTMVDSVSILGLGKLGAPMAACFAARGFRVHAVDLDAK
jgi:hypothetical protein